MKLPGWLIVVLIAVIILAAAGAAVVTVSWLGPVGGDRRVMSNLDAATDVERFGTIGPVYETGTFMVNLNNEGRGTGFLRTSITLEADDQKTVEELDRRVPAVRDAIITVLRAYTSEALAAPDGLDTLRLELQDAVGELLPEGRIVRVFFTDLIMQ